MEEIIELLKNPFDGLSDYESIKKKCEEIAQKLFDNNGIKSGDKIFRFAEIEFYYYDREKYLENPNLVKWQEVTYPRDGYEAGQLFYHLSGIDICFNSQYNTDFWKFGGILIRALKDEKDIIAGPLNCKDEILNACKNGKMPKLIEVKASEKQNIELKQTYRSLGKTGTDKDHDRLCYFDYNSIKKDDWNPLKERFVTKTGNIESKKSSYNTSKFTSV